jgi:hypothetical protein
MPQTGRNPPESQRRHPKQRRPVCGERNATLTDWIYGITYGRDRGVKSLEAGSGSWAHNSFPEQQVQATYAPKEVSVTNRP